MAQALTLYKENYRKPTIFTPRRSWILCTKYKDKSNFQNILNELDLSAVQKQIIITRYLSILENFQRRSRNYSYLFLRLVHYLFQHYFQFKTQIKHLQVIMLQLRSIGQPLSFHY